MKNLRELREDYRRGSLELSDLPTSPDVLFEKWQQDAIDSEFPDPNAFVLATAGSDGTPHQRIVLLKDMQDGGFVFYTNYTSNKADDIEANARVSMLFPWYIMERQVRIEGTIKKSPRSLSDEYFQSRPRKSQIAAWASHQSSVVENREVLENNYVELEKKFKGTDIPTPEFWGGYTIRAERFEFWQGRQNRLHDRFQYSKNKNGKWHIERLAP